MGREVGSKLWGPVQFNQNDKMYTRTLNLPNGKPVVLKAAHQQDLENATLQPDGFWRNDLIVEIPSVSPFSRRTVFIDTGSFDPFNKKELSVRIDYENYRYPVFNTVKPDGTLMPLNKTDKDHQDRYGDSVNWGNVAANCGKGVVNTFSQVVESPQNVGITAVAEGTALKSPIANAGNTAIGTAVGVKKLFDAGINVSGANKPLKKREEACQDLAEGVTTLGLTALATKGLIREHGNPISYQFLF